MPSYIQKAIRFDRKLVWRCKEILQLVCGLVIDELL